MLLSIIQSMSILNAITIFKKLASLLTKSELKSAGMLMGMISIMAFLDALGVASILPFIAVLSSPNLVDTNVWLNTAFKLSGQFGIETIEQFLFFLGILVFLLLVLSLTFKAVTTYAQTRFVLMREFSIGKRLVEGYLHQPYVWFLSRNSADLGKVVLSEVSTVVGYGITPLMTIIAQGTVSLALIILLIAIDPLMALCMSFVLSLSYIIVFALVSGWLKLLGQTRTQANKERFTTLSEAFGAIKEIKAGGLEHVYISRFASQAEIYAKGHAAAHIIGQLPRYALEIIAFGGMMLVSLYLMSRNNNFAAALPVIGVYAFAGYRLMPALQQIYSAFTQLRFVGPALDTLYKDLSTLDFTSTRQISPNYLPLVQAIRLEGISYQYQDALHPALNQASLKISAKSQVAFVGTTGSGKTTIVDVILGLLEPTTGHLIVDGKEITTLNRRSWQNSIGYVPQHIYLADDSVSANIAFGFPHNEIDQNEVERVSKIAHLHDFVVQQLAEGYATVIGERGVRLSGGQRQRIGIARALYRNPRVLILDEATSALDGITEKSIIGEVEKLNNEITIIFIAHRLSTVRKCDQIYLLENGKITANGTYDELVGKNKHFLALTNPSS